MYNSFANATPQNLVKVVPTKTAEGHVSVPARMQRGSFMALVRCGWLKEVQVPAPAGYGRPYFTRYVITPKGEEVLVGAAKLEANPFVGGHGAKAQETFKLLGTKHSDWFHPAVKWVLETRNMPHDVLVACPDCDGVRAVQKDAQGKVIPPPKNDTKDYKSYYARQDYAKAGVACDKCRQKVSGGRGWGDRYESTGKVFSHVEWRPEQMWIGYIVWPKGVVHGASRFNGDGVRRSMCQCEICGKGISKSGRVPVCHDKGGKVFSMWVGQDCAKKFCKVATIAKPTKDQNKKGLPSMLDVNYIVEGE